MKSTKVVLTATVSGIATVYWSYPIFLFRDRRVHIFADNLSRNSCKQDYAHTLKASYKVISEREAEVIIFEITKGHNVISDLIHL